MIHTRTIVAPFVLGLHLVACTETESPVCPEGGKNADGLIDIGGSVIFHSMNRLATERTGNEVEYEHLLVEIVDLNALSSSEDITPLARFSLSTEGCGGSGSELCAYCSGATSIAGITGGIGTVLRDDRTSDAVWMRAITGIATKEQLAELQNAAKPLDPRNAFAVTHDALESVIAPLTGLTADELMARGVIFGLIYSNTQSSGERGTPISGATVTPSDDNVMIVYPNANFSGKASETAKQGVFLAIPKTVDTVKTTSFTVKPPAGESQTWDASRLGFFSPGAVYFHVMYAND